MSADHTKNKPQAVMLSNLNRLKMRRVLKQREGYVCGICRAPYKSQNEAASCLHQCWQSLISRAPWVIQVRGAGRQQFACVYCRRDYDNPERAQACAEECVARMSKSASTPKQTSAQNVAKNFPRPNLRASFRMAFRQLIERAKLADARAEEIRLKEIAAAQGFVCEHCKTNHPTAEKAAECLASHAEKATEKSTEKSTEKPPGSSADKDTKKT